MTAKQPDDSEAELRAKLPPEERRQVDPTLSLARIGRTGVAIELGTPMPPFFCGATENHGEYRNPIRSNLR
jgi:hypothetical protein